MASEVATLAGGCFWCLEAVYQRMRGVSAIRSGYIGGHVDAPSYEQVCSGNTGHAEAVEITFDADAISYRDLLTIFFTIHDPTTVDRQGHDVGSQYRSVIYRHSPQQEATANAVIADLTEQKLFPAPIVTQVEAAGKFYEAEGYHQNYYRSNTSVAYCQFVIEPKLAKLRDSLAIFAV
jgi:peptide-methionine (S)-S-oxide reductase